jgi:hypothetical protein
MVNIVARRGNTLLPLYNVVCVCACVHTRTGFRRNGDEFLELYISSLMFQWEIFNPLNYQLTFKYRASYI